MGLINYSKSVNNAIIIIISIAFIFIGGVFLYKHDSVPFAQKNPIYFALGIAFAGSGGKLVASMILNAMLPPDVVLNMKET
jgi:hypothetical protein